MLDQLAAPSGYPKRYYEYVVSLGRGRSVHALASAQASLTSQPPHPSPVLQCSARTHRVTRRVGLAGTRRAAAPPHVTARHGGGHAAAAARAGAGADLPAGRQLRSPGRAVRRRDPARGDPSICGRPVGPVIAGHMGFAVQIVYNWWDEWIATGGYGVRSRDTEVYLMTNAHWCATLCEPLLSRRRRPR